MADNRTLAKGAMIGGVPVYNNVESTTATTMANTSYFKTEDVDGKPVKISRDNIMGIVKECLGTILSDNSADLGTTITKALALNGSAMGAITPANLALVLGVPPFIQIADGGDCNALSEEGISFHYLTRNISNRPSNDASYLFVLTVCWASNDQWQLACDIVLAKMWFRIKGSVDWGGWKEIATTT